MTETDILQQLRDMRYPGTIDVVAPVMQQVRNKPLLTPQFNKLQRIKRFSTAVAACLILAVGINVTLLFTRNYDEAQISNMIAEVYNYHADYDNMTEAGFGVGIVESLY